MQEGIYSINTYVNIDAGLDVAYFSKDYGARLIIGGIGGTNNQLFQFTPKGSGWQVRGCDSSNMLDSTGQDLIFPGTDNVKYQELMMFGDTNSGGQVWYVENVAGKTVFDSNGYELQVVRIKNGSGKYLCCPGGAISSDANNLNWAIVKDDDPNDVTEWWVLRKQAYYVDYIGVPAALGFADSARGAIANYVVGNGIKQVYPSWICDALSFQLRWRWRGRIARTNSWSGWSPWYSPSGSIADEGYGDMWSHNEVDYNAGRKYGTALSVNCENGTYDKREYQIDVRQAHSGFVTGRLGIPYKGWKGGGAACTVPVYYRPNLQVTNLYITPDGLAIRYRSDLKRNNNTIRIEPIYIDGRPVTNRCYEFNNQPYVGQVCITVDNLAFIPSAGQTWRIPLTTIITDDGIPTTILPVSGSVEYAPGFSALTAPSFTSGAGGEVLAKFDNVDKTSDEHSVTLVYLEGRKYVSVACEKISDGSFRILPPSGKEFDIVWTSTLSGKSWENGSVHHEAITLDNYIWSFDGTYVQAYLFDGVGEAPHSVSRDYAAELTQGRKFESVFFGRGSKGKISIDCFVPIKADEKNPNATIEDMRLLLASEYAVFRTPDGQRHDVAITGMDDQITGKWYYSISVDMVECDNQ